MTNSDLAMNRSFSRALSFMIAFVLVGCLTAQEQTDAVDPTATAHPVPIINQPLVPGAAKPGRAGFVLTVNGTGFVPGSVLHWNGNPRTTTVSSQSRLTASIFSTDIAKAGTASVTVVNPGPGGGTSNAVSFEVARPTSSVTFGISSLHLGFSPAGAVVGDFNGDGKLDLAVANSSGKNVSVLLGNGNGTFKPPLNTGPLPEPQSLAVGDFNGDGKLDLAVTNLVDGNVSILLGNGNGTFGAPLNFSTGNYPSSIAVGDFNGDGKLDLAVANSGNTGVSSLSVLLGLGDGTFNNAVQYGVGCGADSVVVGDFNGDGKLDLAVANVCSSDVSVLLGRGDGTFNSAVNYFAGGGCASVAAGDFNGDGKLDLAVANVGNPMGFGSVSVLLGNGDGTFEPAVNYGVGSNPQTVVVGDFNGDGKLDFAVANYGGFGNVANLSLLLGNGNGTFQPATQYDDVGTNVSSLAVGDFNGDGRADLAIAGSELAVLVQPPLLSGLDAVLEPGDVIFAPAQLLGTTSPVQPVRLSNYGTVALDIAAISSSGDFSQTHNCGSSLAPGASCMIRVAFKPMQPGTRTGTLSVADDAAGSPQKISLSGTGTEVEFNPASLRFTCFTYCGPSGCSCLCSHGGQKTTLTNIGRTTLDINDVTVAGPFSVTNSCPAHVGAGQSCALTVGWAHISGDGEVSVSDNGGGSPQTVALSGVKQCSPAP